MVETLNHLSVSTVETLLWVRVPKSTCLPCSTKAARDSIKGMGMTAFQWYLAGLNP
jgi:hypothetical protein